MKESFSERFSHWWYRTPRAFTGGVLVNRLGWQILRVVWFNIWRRLGFVLVLDDIAQYARALRRDGIVIIPNFLSPEVQQEIRKEFEKEAASVPIKPHASKYVLKEGEMTRIGVGHFVPEKDTKLRALLDQHIIKNDLLARLGSTVVNHRIRTFREPQVFINKFMGEQYPDLNSDIFYHADVSYPGVKAFYYLSDTTAYNGAFTYVKGSHKLNFKRLWWDYRKSIEVAKNKKRVNNPAILGDADGRSWHCLTREEEKRDHVVGTPMIGTAGSVVMFNVMGFHRRGEFSPGAEREFAMAYYRN